MKISYDIKSKTIITWWSEETGKGESDTVWHGEEDTKKIYEFVDISSPSDLIYPITCYVINERGDIIPHSERIKMLNPKLEPSKHNETFNFLLSRAICEINKAADKIRAEYFTINVGLLSVYLMKEVEARNFILNNCPDDTTNYIMLSREASERKIPIDKLAMSIIKKVTEWKLVSSDIECTRLTYIDLLKSLSLKTTTNCDVNAITKEAITTLHEI